ncbi:MAG: TonB-dependent receptor plug domain-containing protein, partial [Sphingomonas sp.]|nr:TonB-dependent receptor plug domain-containing protein [Sphingomonas sp.]
MTKTDGLAKRRSFAAGDMAASLALMLGAVPAAAAAHETGEADKAPKTDVTVTAARDAKTAVDRLTLPIAEQPQAITEISREDLERRGVSNLNDALRNVAGLSLGAGETSFQGNNAILRGFTTRNDLFVDNARDYGYYFRDSFDDARIDVL